MVKHIENESLHNSLDKSLIINPDIKAALTWLPVVLVLAIIIRESFKIHEAKKKCRLTIPWNPFNSARIFLVIVLLILTLIDNSLNIHFNDSHSSRISLGTPFIKSLGYLVLSIVYLLQRRAGIHTSASIWLYLVVQLVGESLDLYTTILLFDSNQIGTANLTFKSLQFSGLALLFLLECWADTPVYIPDTSDDQPESPEPRASYLSKITFWWFNKFMLYGYKNNIRISDLWKTLREEKASFVCPEFVRIWKEKADKSRRANSYYLANGELQRSSNLFVVLVILFWKKVIYVALLIFLQNMLVFLNPILLKGVLNFFTDSGAPVWYGQILCVSLFLVPVISGILQAKYFQRTQKIGMQAQSMIIGSVYRKSLLLSNSARRQATSGDIANLIGVDSQRILNGFLFFNFLWSAPLQIIVALMILYAQLGWSILGGVLYMVLALPVNTYCAKWLEIFETKLMRTKDKRIKKINELLSGIKVIKLYAWENSFLASISGLRSEEVRYLRKSMVLDGLQEIMWLSSPVFVAIVTFGVYISIDGNELTAEKAFVAISLFNLLKSPLMILPGAISATISARVSARRISKFLNSDELFKYVTRDEAEDDDDDAITINEGTADWSEKGDSGTDFMLRDINLHVKRGSFVAVVGQVGSGKSSLLSSMIGDMHRVSGRFNICKDHTLAYVPQQAWIQNMTIKDNILFGQDYDENVYHSVLSSCSLLPDLAILPGRDHAEIGEKGINLSGGQKQRVSLARACYSNADIYLLDDPLSALDSHVGKRVFDEVLSSSSGLLRDKTRVLATNSLFVLPSVDHVIVLEGGRIVESGKYNELMAREKGYLTEIMRQYSSKSEQESDKLVEDEKTKVNVERLMEEFSLESVVTSRMGKLTDSEKVEYTGVDFSVYLKYFKALTYRWLVPYFILQALSLCFNVSSNLWLASWTSDSKNVDHTKNSSTKWMRLAVYAVLGLLYSLVVLGATLCACLGPTRAAKWLHSSLIDNVIHSPMSFFDTTPMGRIVNRFSKDVNTVDQLIPAAARRCSGLVILVISTLIIDLYSFYMFILVAIPVAIIYYMILRLFIATTRQLRRIEPITRSPLFSHFNETFTGATTIRAYDSVNRFIATSDRLTDINHSSNMTIYICDRWLSVRLEFLGGLITFAIALFSIYSRDTISPGIAGLTITYSLDLTQVLGWLIWQISDLENNIVSVDRILEYNTNSREDSWVKDQRPPSNWPDEGSIQLQNYSTRYRDNLDLVLQDVSISIRPREKIGIVGRTGSGKSSLALSMFRLIEPANGQIIIDGLNLSDYGLHDIRSRLTIIPQDPVLFSGTLRYNLDPLDQQSDDEIWLALELAHLKEYARSLDSGLDYTVNEHGENFSVGQRQLICLARAILRKTKILILDEATASVDVETDSIVQSTIRQIFSDCTIITIAHRLHTILDSDRILVLDKGKVKELDSPKNLLSDVNSAFSALVRDAGFDSTTYLMNSKIKT